MSDTVESTTKIERTPAQVAEALEARARALEVAWNGMEALRKRNLAIKVREVKSGAVSERAGLELQRLHATLPPLERKDLEEAGGVPTNRTAIAAISATAAATVSRLSEKADNLGLGKLGIMDAIKDWIRKSASEELSADADILDKIWHGFKMFFLKPLAAMFGVEADDKKKAEEVAPKGGAHADVKASSEIHETGTDTIFNLWAQAIVAFSSHKKDYSSQEIRNAPLFLATIKDKSFASISDIFARRRSGYEEFARDLWVPSADGKTAELVVLSLLSNESLLASFFKKTKHVDDWKTLPLKDIIPVVGSESQQLMKIQSVESEEDVKRLLSEMTMSFGKDGKMTESLRSKYESIKERFSGMTPKVLGEIFTLKPEDITEDYINTAFQDPKEREFIRETLIPFRDKFLAMLGNSSVNGWKPLDQYFRGADAMRMDELLMVFIRTWGHVSFEEMNSPEQASLYQSIFSLLMKRNEEEAAAYMTRLLNTESTHIPPEVQRILITIGDKGKDLVIKTIASFMNISVGVFKELTVEQQLWVLAAGAIFVLAGRFVFSLKVAVISLWLVAFIGWSTVSAITSSVKES